MSDPAVPAVPANFEPFEPSPFARHIGPLFACWDTGTPVIGALIAHHHANSKGSAHGGLLVTIADVALGQAARAVLREGAVAVTADMHVTFLAAVAIGDWVEAHPTIDRAGRSLIYATCELRVVDRPVVKVSSILAVRTASPRE